MFLLLIFFNYFQFICNFKIIKKKLFLFQTHEYQHQPSQFLPPVQQSDNLFTPDSVNIDDDIFLIQSNMEIEC